MELVVPLALWSGPFSHNVTVLELATSHRKLFTGSSTGELIMWSLIPQSSLASSASFSPPLQQPQPQPQPQSQSQPQPQPQQVSASAPQSQPQQPSTSPPIPQTIVRVATPTVLMVGKASPVIALCQALSESEEVVASRILFLIFQINLNKFLWDLH